MTTHGRLQELIPLYALDALEGGERLGVEAHIRDCPICQLEVGEYQLVTALLTSDEPAPEHLWGRIASALGEEPDIPLSHHAEILDLGEVRSRRRVLPWLTAVAAAAALVFGGIAVAQRSVLNDLNGESAVLAAAEQASSGPGSYVGDFIVDGAAVAQVVLTADGHGFVIPGENLATLGADRTYQLWVITSDEQVISGGVLGNEPNPSTFTWTGEVSGFALTREVAGGVVVSDGDVVAVASEI